MIKEIFSFLVEEPNVSNALATISIAGIALFALIVSIVSVWFTRRQIALLHKHNVLSVRPIPLVELGDYEDCLVVKLVNNGSGPLIINSIEIHLENEIRESLIEWMPELPSGIDWTAFVGPVCNRSVSAGGKIRLLKLKGDSSVKKFCAFRDDCRKALRSLNVIVNYTDIYETKMASYQRTLEWFGRNL